MDLARSVPLLQPPGHGVPVSAAGWPTSMHPCGLTASAGEEASGWAVHLALCPLARHLPAAAAGTLAPRAAPACSSLPAATHRWVLRGGPARPKQGPSPIALPRRHALWAAQPAQPAQPVSTHPPRHLQGDAALSVVRSPNPSGGPFTCVGSDDNGCPAADGAFRLAHTVLGNSYCECGAGAVRPTGGRPIASAAGHRRSSSQCRAPG